MGKYNKSYPNGWKNSQIGGTPMSADAFNNMESGIEAAFRTENMIAIYGQPINFTNGVGYFYDTRIHTGAAVPFVQLRAAAIDSIVKTTLGVTVEEGRLVIVMDYAKTVANLPVNIIVILA